MMPFEIDAFLFLEMYLMTANRRPVTTTSARKNNLESAVYPSGFGVEIFDMRFRSAVASG